MRRKLIFSINDKKYTITTYPQPFTNGGQYVVNVYKGEGVWPHKQILERVVLEKDFIDLETYTEKIKEELK